MHNQHALVNADVFVHLHVFDAALRVSSNNDAPVEEGIRVQLGYCGSGSSWARIQGDAGFSSLFFMGIIGLAKPAAEVGLQVVGDAAPGLQELFIGAYAPGDVGLVWPEEGLHGLGAQFLGLLVVFAAETVDVVAPEIVDKSTHGVGILDGVPVDLQMVRQDVYSVGSRGQYADALLRRQTEALGLGAGQIHSWVRLLIDPGQDPPSGHVPELPFPGELVGLPDLGQHS